MKFAGNGGMRFAIAGLLVVHGLIHLLGFLKPWKLAEVPQLSGPSSRAVGLVWLLVTVLLVIAAVLAFLARDSWWVPAAVGVVLSQVLIILQWSDAKFGTIANVLIAVPIVMAIGTARFHAASEARARELVARAPPGPASIVTAQELASLPAPVKRWLEGCGVVGKPRAKTVKLLERGALRTNPHGPFMPTEATQSFTVEEPGFVWAADVVMMGVPVVARDTYLEGHGRMFIKAGGLITVADGKGPRFDQGTLLRFLGEIIWFPSAALAPYIHWEPIDDRTAKATMSWRGTSASAIFDFDERGRVKGLSARRYLGGKSLEDWAIPITEWKTVRGVEIPTRGHALWKLAGGDFDYFRWEITDVITAS